MGVDLWVDEFEVAERRKKRRTEIFIGGLDKEAKEEDIRKVFEKAGEIVEVRLIKNSQTGKNKGYAFLRYAKPDEAQRAINELARAEVCGKPCAAAPLQDNDTIFLGSIDKRWKKEDVIRILQEIGIENIHTVYVMMDPNNPGHNRGFAFLELETNKDAQNAYRKLQKKDVFGKGRNVKVAWAEPLNDPGEEEMQKVKSVYANGIPASWDEEKVKKYFSKYGEIERIKLAKDMHNPKRKDFAFVNYATREAALACIESFNKEEVVDEGCKVNIKVMLAKPVQKSNQNKGRTKVPDVEQSKEKIKQSKEKRNEAHDRPMENIVPSKKGRFIGKGGPPPSIEKKSSDTEELIRVLREQAAWKQGTSGFARVSAIEDYSHGLPGGKRPLSALGEDPYSEPRGYSRARDSSFPHTSTSSFSYDGAGTSIPFYQRHSAGYAGSAYTSGSDYSTSGKMRYGTYSYGGGPSLGS
ncbi:heterogeneous nuclear ribonucleoprotein Q-like [Nymphaea colorata]|nr:heterogeneous nuclear ribonucleoprotein Q-like [Nymphaea colorata]